MGTLHVGRKFFTLIELLAVLALAVLLSALAVPAFSGLSRADKVNEAAAVFKRALEYARVRAVNDRCCVAVILPNGGVSTAIERYRLAGCRLAYVEKSPSGDYAFTKWLDRSWRAFPRGGLLVKASSSAFVPDASGDILDCTAAIGDRLAGASECLVEVADLKDDAGSPLNAGAPCAVVFDASGKTSKSGKSRLLFAEALAGDAPAIVYPTAVVTGSNRSSNNVILKVNNLTGIVEYDN